MQSLVIPLFAGVRLRLRRFWEDALLAFCCDVALLAIVARPPPPVVPLTYPFVWRKGVLNGYSSTGVSLWDAPMFGRVLEY